MPALRVLVIDDDDNVLQMIELAVRRAGIEVLPASHGQLGLQRFREEQPDLAIIDIAMPGLDGFDVIKGIRAYEAEQGLNPTPIIILSAYTQTSMETYATDLNVDLYLTKPVLPRKLIEEISTLTGRQLPE